MSEPQEIGASVEGPLAGFHTHVKSWQRETISLAEIAELLRDDGIVLWLLLFTAIPAMPLPVPPGINLMIALPVLLIALQFVLGRQALWLPGWLGRRRLKVSLIDAGLGHINKVLSKLQRRSRRRLHRLHSVQVQKLLGLLWLVCGLCIAVPIPFSNTTPSAGILLSGLGILLEDGLVTLAGVAISIAGICMTIGMIFFGNLILEQLQQWF